MSCGHTWSDIQEYTMPQFKAFVKSAEKAKREEVAMMIQAASFAMADGKAVKKTVDGLLNAPN